ncbi:hypothetical protein DFH29DRAFT_983167 [Suillus ampliporus]|nr:hypothetical protein DFH29DRAFT_983167 [Suillus ampliporus]
MAFNENPNEAVRPNFTLDDHQEAREQLTNDGLTDDQAARALASLWTITNNVDKVRWADKQERLAAAKQRAEEEENQRQQTLLEEEETARLEERKKNKNKYAPLRHGKVPSDPTIIPTPYATRKLKAGDYCELYYFTNKGLEDAKKTTLIAEPDALVMLPATDGVHSWIPAAAVKDPKSSITRDENLTWEEFNEAAPRMISSMKIHDWPEDRTHHWRHAPDQLKQ